MKIKYLTSRKPTGFTIVELVVVITVISILAGITTVSFGTWRERAAKQEVQSNLLNITSLMKQQLNFNNTYPTTIPTDFKASKNVVIEMTQAPSGKYCFNGYSTVSNSIRMSIDSDHPTTPQDSLCDGASNGSTSGGSVPSTPLNKDIAPGLNSWTLAGTASYDDSGKTLTLGSNGSVLSPVIRVEGASAVKIDGLFYATVQSSNTSKAPDGGWHVGSQYFAADGVTAKTNTSGYTGNGCARAVTLGSWNPSKEGVCSFPLGNGIVYLRLRFYSAASGYSSPDLKIKSPSVILY